MRSAAMPLIIVGLSVAASANVPPPISRTPREWIVGTWSFDGSCASGFGVTLKQDGKAGYDEYGAGLWALADSAQRLVLIIEDISEEADRKKEAELIEFRITARGGNAMTLIRLSDKAKLQAVRCRA